MPRARKQARTLGTKAKFPDFIEPALATTIEKPPSGERWVHEIKFDGYRVQVHIFNTEVKVFTRRGNDWTKRFKKIAADAWRIHSAMKVPGTRELLSWRRSQHNQGQRGPSATAEPLFDAHPVTGASIEVF